MNTIYNYYYKAACFLFFAMVAIVPLAEARNFSTDIMATKAIIINGKDNTNVCFSRANRMLFSEKNFSKAIKNRQSFFSKTKPLAVMRGQILQAPKVKIDLNTAKSQLSNIQHGFEENKGQVRNAAGVAQQEVTFRYCPNKNTSVYLTTMGLVYQFTRNTNPATVAKGAVAKSKNHHPSNQFHSAKNAVQHETYRMDMLLVGASPNATISAEGESAAFNQYFFLDDAIKTKQYQRVTYHQVYPGIDWVIYLNGKGGLKYDFVVHPGADPSQIRLRYKNAENIQIANDGKLTIANRLGKIIEDAPLSFQDGVQIKSAFSMRGSDIVFSIAPYETSKTLVIDPALNWATYYGDTRDETVYATEVDSNGNVYIAGTTNSGNMASGGYDNTLGSTGNTDAFLAKFNASGVLQWATYYGGADDDMGYDVAVDEVDNVILCGSTKSSSSIASSGAHQTAKGGKTDAFVVKFDSGGSRTWATYYGGSEDEQGISCITDNNRAVYLCGATKTQESVGGNSDIGTSGAHQTVLRNELGVDAVAGFLVKFNSTGVRQWGTYFGGETKTIADAENDATAVTCCSIDSNNNVYVSGTTGSNDLPLSGHKGAITGSEDFFLAKFNSNGVLQWGTYYYDVEGSNFPVTILNDGLSNTNAEIASCDVDADNNVILCGRANVASGVVTAGAYKATHSGGSDTYLVKFNSSGSRVWGTYVGGNNNEYPKGVCVDSNGNIYIAGFTNSDAGLAIGGELTTYQSYTTGSVAFLVKFDSNGSYEWGTYHGGTNLTVDYGLACAVNNSTNQVYLAGVANSATGIASGGHQNTKSGFTDGFLAQFKRSTFLPVTLSAFTANCFNGQVSIKWTTLTELQNKKFIVESSYDQRSWKMVADVPGAGNTTQPRHYNLLDADANPAIRFYRLRQIDFDGKESYSQIVSVQCGSGSKPKLVVYPNPAVEYLTIQGLVNTANYRLVNAMGQSVRYGQLSPSNASINVAVLQPGIYYLSIENKQEHFTQKVEIK